MKSWITVGDWTLGFVWLLISAPIVLLAIFVAPFTFPKRARSCSTHRFSEIAILDVAFTLALIIVPFRSIPAIRDWKNSAHAPGNVQAHAITQLFVKGIRDYCAVGFIAIGILPMGIIAWAMNPLLWSGNIDILDRAIRRVTADKRPLDAMGLLLRHAFAGQIATLVIFPIALLSVVLSPKRFNFLKCIMQRHVMYKAPPMFLLVVNAFADFGIMLVSLLFSPQRVFSCWIFYLFEGNSSFSEFLEKHASYPMQMKNAISSRLQSRNTPGNGNKQCVNVNVELSGSQLLRNSSRIAYGKMYLHLKLGKLQDNLNKNLFLNPNGSQIFEREHVAVGIDISSSYGRIYRGGLLQVLLSVNERIYDFTTVVAYSKSEDEESSYLDLYFQDPFVDLEQLAELSISEGTTLLHMLLFPLRPKPLADYLTFLQGAKQYRDFSSVIDWESQHFLLVSDTFKSFEITRKGNFIFEKQSGLPNCRYYWFFDHRFEISEWETVWLNNLLLPNLRTFMISKLLRSISALFLQIEIIVVIIIIPWTLFRALYIIMNKQMWIKKQIKHMASEIATISQDFVRIADKVAENVLVNVNRDPISFDLGKYLCSAEIFLFRLLPYYRYLQGFEKSYSSLLSSIAIPFLKEFYKSNEMHFSSVISESILHNYIMNGQFSDVDKITQLQQVRILLERMKNNLREKREASLLQLQHLTPETHLKNSNALRLAVKEAIHDIQIFLRFAVCIISLHRFFSFFKKGLCRRNIVIHSNYCFQDLKFFIQFLFIFLTIFNLPLWIEMYTEASSKCAAQDLYDFICLKTDSFFWESFSILTFCSGIFKTLKHVSVLFFEAFNTVFYFYDQTFHWIFEGISNNHDVVSGLSYVMGKLITISIMFGPAIIIPFLIAYFEKDISIEYFLISEFFLIFLGILAALKKTFSQNSALIRSNIRYLDIKDNASIVKLALLLYDVFQLITLSITVSIANQSANLIYISPFWSYLIGLSSNYKLYSFYVSLILVFCLFSVLISQKMLLMTDKQDREEDVQSIWNSPVAFISLISNNLFMFVCISLANFATFSDEKDAVFGLSSLIILCLYTFLSQLALNSSPGTFQQEPMSELIRIDPSYSLIKNILNLALILSVNYFKGNVLIAFSNVFILFSQILVILAFDRYQKACSLKLYTYVYSFGLLSVLFVNCLDYMLYRQIITSNLCSILVAYSFGIFLLSGVVMIIFEPVIRKKEIENSPGFITFSKQIERLVEHIGLLRKNHIFFPSWTKIEEETVSRQLKSARDPFVVRNLLVSIENAICVQFFSEEYRAQKRLAKTSLILIKDVNFEELSNVIDEIILSSSSVKLQNEELFNSPGDNKFFRIIEYSNSNSSIHELSLTENNYLIDFQSRVSKHIEHIFEESHECILRILGHPSLAKQQKLNQLFDLSSNSVLARPSPEKKEKRLITVKSAKAEWL